MKIIDEKSRFLALIVGIYVLAIGIGTPLIIRNGYFDILVVKYYYYCFCTILLSIVIILTFPNYVKLFYTVSIYFIR